MQAVRDGQNVRELMPIATREKEGHVQSVAHVVASGAKELEHANEQLEVSTAFSHDGERRQHRCVGQRFNEELQAVLNRK